MRGLVARRLGQYSRQEMHGKVARLQRELAAQKAAHEAAMRSLQARLGSVSKAGRREALDRTDEQAMSRAWRVGGQRKRTLYLYYSRHTHYDAIVCA